MAAITLDFFLPWLWRNIHAQPQADKGRIKQWYVQDGPQLLLVGLLAKWFRWMHRYLQMANFVSSYKRQRLTFGQMRTFYACARRQKGWVLLNEVPLGFELSRKMNNFPPVYEALQLRLLVKTQNAADLEKN